MTDQSTEGKAALMLMAALVDALERDFPGTNRWIDQYLIEMASRPVADKDALSMARDLLAGLRGED